MQNKASNPDRRVVLAYWKDRKSNSFEVFSSLKNFCAHYPDYSYSTLSNYLSKQKKPYETEVVYVDRKKIIGNSIDSFKLVPVVRKAQLHEIDEEKEDVAYWLTRLAKERLSAVTFMISQTLTKGERMDKSIIRKSSGRQI